MEERVGVGQHIPILAMTADVIQVIKGVGTMVADSVILIL